MKDDHRTERSWSAGWAAKNPAGMFLRGSFVLAAVALVLCWIGISSIASANNPTPEQLAGAFVTLGQLRDLSAFGIQLLWFGLGMWYWSACTPQQPSYLSDLTWWKVQIAGVRKQGGLWNAVGLTILCVGAVMLMRDALAAAAELLMYAGFDIATPSWLASIRPITGGGFCVAAGSIICWEVAPAQAKAAEFGSPKIRRAIACIALGVGGLKFLASVLSVIAGSESFTFLDETGSLSMIAIGIYLLGEDAKLRCKPSSGRPRQNR